MKASRFGIHSYAKRRVKLSMALLSLTLLIGASALIVTSLAKAATSFQSLPTTLQTSTRSSTATTSPPAIGPETQAAQSENETAARLEELGGAPCPESEFTCVTFTLPLDHFDPTVTETIEVVFGVLPATGERKGIFVTATGGPGSSGLSAADSYTAAFDPAIPEQFDIVFFDQRGVATFGGLQCPEAAVAYYQADSQTDTPEQEAATVAITRTFTQACLRELGSRDELSYLGTRQAVEDLEAFRIIMRIILALRSPSPAWLRGN